MREINEVWKWIYIITFYFTNGFKYKKNRTLYPTLKYYLPETFERTSKIFKY